MTDGVIAFFLFGLPVALLTYAVMGYCLYAGALPDFEDRASRKLAMRRLRKGPKMQGGGANILLRRWVGFGGGFYGTVAVFTYIVMEAQDIWTFFVFILDPVNWTFQITIDLVIRLIINTIMNFLNAALWFTIWLRDKSPYEILIWLGVVYGSFVIASRLARRHFRSGRGHMTLWPQMPAWLGLRQHMDDLTPTDPGSGPDPDRANIADGAAPPAQAAADLPAGYTHTKRD